MGGGADRSDAEVEAFEDGTVEVRTSSADMGQGLSTVLAQCAAEELGLSFGQVRVLLSDTDLTPNGGPTTASRQTYMSGNAVRIAAANLREMLTKVVAEELDCPPERVRFEEGLARQNGTAVKFGDVIKLAHRQGMETRILQEYYGPRTQPLGTGGDMHSPSRMPQVALVSVDLNTGEVTVHKIISAADVGGRSIALQTRGGSGRDRHGAEQRDRSVHRRGRRALVDAAFATDAEHPRRRSSAIWSSTRPPTDRSARRASAATVNTSPAIANASTTPLACACSICRSIRTRSTGRWSAGRPKSTRRGRT
ncbi:MAG: molybdopterin-dependent oxidoreductase [Anaerolineae bacterium]|nr:molybdopterin-dependent oxidoreductase [Anaerolineae bacterium]